VRVSNISLVYLIVVLWLAAVYGRGPAILSSLISFLAYDFYFIPPLHRFTIDDPTEWVSLGALLATSLVLGQLTAAVQSRAREAIESQQRTATLYALAQLIASTTDQEALVAALTARVQRVFAPFGVVACALYLPDEQRKPRLAALAPEETPDSQRSPLAATLRLEAREHEAQASYAFTRGAPVGGAVMSDQESSAHLASSPSSASATSNLIPLVFFVPLRSGKHIVAVLGLVGSSDIRQLIAGTLHTGAKEGTAALGASTAALSPQARLFAAFCDQMALALDRAELQQQAIHAEALRESDQLKNVLLGSVTHDLRTPLASIMAATSSLLDEHVQWSEADRHEFLESINSSAERLNRLVSNLLDLSRLEAGVAEPEKDWYLIGDVVATVLDRLDLAGLTHDHTLTVAIPETVPLVPMDHTQIEQVVTNLVENALKYSPAGSAIRITARVLKEPAELEVRVSDQGIGIPANELGNIFDKFYRVQQVRLPWSTRPPAGTGLGLAITANIIRAHEGRIWAESQVGKGTTIVFTLPIPADGPQGRLPEVASLAQETVYDARGSELPAHATDRLKPEIEAASGPVGFSPSRVPRLFKAESGTGTQAPTETEARHG
jgi:two-component system sensor histidine kinase KdpD